MQLQNRLIYIMPMHCPVKLRATIASIIVILTRTCIFLAKPLPMNNVDKAFINGLLMSVDPHVDMSFLYRKISRGYQSLYTNAFTESTYPTNESGFYAGISIAPSSYLRINAYADFYHFPWLKFRVDAPSSGSDYLVQLTILLISR